MSSFEKSLQHAVMALVRKTFTNQLVARLVAYVGEHTMVGFPMQMQGLMDTVREVHINVFKVKPDDAGCQICVICYLDDTVAQFEVAFQGDVTPTDELHVYEIDWKDISDESTPLRAYSLTPMFLLPALSAFSEEFGAKDATADDAGQKKVVHLADYSKPPKT